MSKRVSKSSFDSCIKTKNIEEGILSNVDKAKSYMGNGEATLEDMSFVYEALQKVKLYINEQGLKGQVPPELVYTRIVEMCLEYLLRPQCTDNNLSDSRWDLIQLVYSILQGVVTLEGGEELLRASIPESSMQNLLQGFASRDQRERDKLKVLVHRLYCGMYTRRPWFRRRISDLLLAHLYQERVPGVRELLQLYGCIASGLALPFRQEHLVFLKKVLLPLHKGEEVEKYHKFLTYCIVNFLYKDATLANTIFTGLLKYWPKSSSESELLFLQELQDLLQVIEPFEFKKLDEMILAQVSKCIVSPVFQVSERTMSLLENQRVLSLCLSSPRTVLPALLPALLSAPKTTSPAKLLDLLTCLEAADPQLFALLADVCRQPQNWHAEN